MAASPEAEGVSSAKLIRWIDACEREIDCLHGFVFLRHGKVIAEGSWKPYDTLNETHFLSSHSKCFVTTAVGFLVDEGVLDLDERVIDILADGRIAVIAVNNDPNPYEGRPTVAEGHTVVQALTDDEAEAAWDGGRLRLAGNAGILLMLGRTDGKGR